MKLSRRLDRIFGLREAAVTVPPMDGALRPNSLLDQMQCYAAREPDNIVFWNGAVVFSSGNALYRLHEPQAIMHFDQSVTCLAAADDGRLAVGLSGAGLRVLGATGREIAIGPDILSNVTAAAFTGDRVIACQGSDRHSPEQWARSLMERGCDGDGHGSVWSMDRHGEWSCMARGLHYPAGVACLDDGAIVVSEAWRHRLVRVDVDGSVQPLLVDLPGYPCRLAAAQGGGHWLAIFAPRTQLVEFVLREDEYRRRMIAQIAEEYWIAPALRSGQSYLEPLQGGAVKQMGIMKPWAPSRSTGLLVRLDREFQPVESFHSRADGTRHGVTSVLDSSGTVHATCKGGDCVVCFPATECSA